MRRNSRMFDMIFVGTSHCLSEYIFSLDNRCKKLSYRERIGVKEKLNPDLRFVLQNLNFMQITVLFASFLLSEKCFFC